MKKRKHNIFIKSRQNNHKNNNKNLKKKKNKYN